MHGHSHAHPHPALRPFQGGSRVRKQDIVHFSIVAVSSILFFILFSFEILWIRLIWFSIWSLISFAICFLGVLHVPLPYIAPFLTRFSIISLLFFTILSWMTTPSIGGIGNGEGERWVHLDLKGGVMSISYLTSIIPEIAKYGATGLVIEYEDTLPYQPPIDFLSSSKFHYSEAEINSIIESARNAGLEVVPLVQTFGHLEFALKHDELANIREIESHMDSLCPLKEESFTFITRMIDQVLSYHPNTKYIHLGGDEVRSLGMCPRCREYTKPELYLKHLIPIIKHVQKKGIQPLIWDDMLRRWDEESLLQLARLNVKIVVWNYLPSLSQTHHMYPPEMWSKFSRVFKGNLWAASSFKGATEKSTDFPPLENHISNHKSWMEMSRKYHFGGIILTGWSRFEHFAPLCELLPTSIPSLALNLALVKHGELNEHIKSNILNKLGLNGMPFEYNQMLEFAAESKGNFPGAGVFRAVAQLELLKQKKASINLEEIDAVRSTLQRELSDILSTPDLEEYLEKLDKLSDAVSQT